MEQTQANKNLSQWFNLDDQKPWEPGVYEVREEFDIGTNQKWYSYWNGKKFMYYTHISEHDAFEKKSQPTGCITSHWRGLASDPSAKPKPKARGNRRVTRYVVMQRTNYASDYPLAAFDDCNFADAYIASNKKSARLPMYIQKIRFRTPEVD